MSNLPQQTTINQYLADGITTVYNYTFLILSATSDNNDISVYVTPSGQPANPLADIKVLNNDYTVQNVGNVNGGTITFQPGSIPPASSIVTIVRTMAVSIDTEFSQAQNFNGANLDSAFERVVLIMQQLNTYYMNNALSYVINSYLPSLGTNFVPVLTNVDNQVWISQGGKIIAAVLQNDNMSTLRSQLASQVPNGDGASLIGFYDQVLNVGTTLDNFLNTFPRPNNGNLIIGGFMTTNPFQRGTSFTTPAAESFIADRIAWVNQGTPPGRIDSSQANDSPTVAQSGMYGTKSLKLAVHTADASIAATDAYGIQYRMEGYDWTFIAQRTFTLSFWVKSNLPGTYVVAIANQGGDKTYLQEYTISQSNVWQEVIITVPASPSAGTWNYVNGVGIYITWCLGSGANWQGQNGVWQNNNYFATPSQVNFMSSTSNLFYIDRISVEPGTLRTPWVARPEEEELALCERYYQKSYNIADAPGASTFLGVDSVILGRTVSTGSGIWPSKFRTRMRANPTVHAYSPNSGTIDKAYDGDANADFTVSYNYQNETGFFLYLNNGGTLTDGHYISWQWAANAEL